MLNRRAFLTCAAALAAPPALVSSPALAQIPEARSFDFAWLKGVARSLAGKAYRAPTNLAAPALGNLTLEQWQSIRFRPERALWTNDQTAFRAHFFHQGRGFREPVHIYEVIAGRMRRITFDYTMFDYQGAGFDPRSLPKTTDFAGFRLSFQTDWSVDIASFLGASYFRAVGGDKQYGLSARGLAIDTGLNRPEEFPVFNNFFIERPGPTQTHLTVYALMDSPSIAGAYRFEITPGEPLTMDIDAALYPRTQIERLGIAPLTSMYQYGENDRRVADDWRPEVHDSDELALWTGPGERIWRPLMNPPSVRVNSYVDDNPRGFGLLQRDRQFDHYQDDGLFYEKRPCAWIEPKPVSGQAWGKGTVQLVEIPTIDETSDNIVTYWNPAAKVVPQREMLVSYRLYWGANAPFSSGTAQVVATRDGIGGAVGQRRSFFSWRFVVDFAGGMLNSLASNSFVDAVVTASRGKVELISTHMQPQINGYRAMFDLRLTDESLEPVNLRLYLRLNQQPLTETWTYQWTPPSAAERKHWLLT